ncbi:MAG: hypothetical protein KKG95_08000 [Candidatus Omnitrophica bacterium]|nr:hypothetical protein [Candidatus Omnitrophota bacterium]
MNNAAVDISYEARATRACEIKRELKRLGRELAELEPALLDGLADGETVATAAGALTRIRGGETRRLDAKAATAALESAGLPVPYAVSQRRASLRYAV